MPPEILVCVHEQRVERERRKRDVQRARKALVLHAEFLLQQSPDAGRQRALRALIAQRKRLISDQHVVEPQVELRGQVGRCVASCERRCVAPEPLPEQTLVLARQLHPLPLAFEHANRTKLRICLPVFHAAYHAAAVRAQRCGGRANLVRCRSAMVDPRLKTGACRFA